MLLLQSFLGVMETGTDTDLIKQMGIGMIRWIHIKCSIFISTLIQFCFLLTETYKQWSLVLFVAVYYNKYHTGT